MCSLTRDRWYNQIPEGGCPHANLVTKRAAGLDDEWEYLFAPYSAFTVRQATESWHHRGPASHREHIDIGF